MNTGSPAEEAKSLSVQDKRNQDLCRRCCAQGTAGYLQLQRLTKGKSNEQWVRSIPLNDAIQTGNITCLRYLVDAIKVGSLNVKVNYTPLQYSVIWGQYEIMVFLLSRGADPMLGTTYSVVDMARVRQQRLREALERTGDGLEFEGASIPKKDIKSLLGVGSDMLVVLEGTESLGSYDAFAKKNGQHPLVRRFAGDVSSGEVYYRLIVLRALILAGKASILPEAERTRLLEEEAAQAAERAKEEQDLTDALEKAGFSSSSSKDIASQLGTPTVKALRARKLSQTDAEKKLDSLVWARRITEGESRKFVRFVRELEEPSVRPAPDAPSKVTAKTAPKSKAKAAPAAKAALMALNPKGAGRGAAGYPQAKNVQVKKKPQKVDGMAMLFDDDLPLGAFILITRFFVVSSEVK